eukprot:1155099-Pelagomonas_calceolata.AAC.1
MSKRTRVAGSTRGAPRYGRRHRRTRHHSSSTWTREYTAQRHAGQAGDPNLHTLFCSHKKSTCSWGACANVSIWGDESHFRRIWSQMVMMRGTPGEPFVAMWRHEEFMGPPFVAIQV